MTLSWHTSTGLPVRSVRSLSAEKCGECSSLFKSLLVNIKGVLDNHDSCYGIAPNLMEVRNTVETVQACAPNLTQTSGCMMQRNSSFSERECLGNIMKDLAHYAAAIQSYVNSSMRSSKEAELLNSTLGIIQRLRKDCSLKPNEEDDSSEEGAAQMWGTDTYDNRQKMCKMMRGFQVRTITINRAMGYISSGDHMK
ncbi:interleukin-12 subunit alpha [Plectropomus leopardus]|uniref:interleukin-12 subunit alpha n=1 Tax=Plectropomus leopardus TaxID=160734 RepID=UPI001C4B2DC7|nr:interleukin-12 subunit alpha [Plectropomus leopardus]